MLSISLGSTLACTSGEDTALRPRRVPDASAGERAIDAGADAGQTWYEWFQQFGSNESEAFRAVAADGSGALFAAGATQGELPGLSSAGAGDLMVVRFDSRSGGVVWRQQFGTEFDDVATELSLGPRDTLYLVGETDGALGDGEPGQTDAFVAKLSTATGDFVWIAQFGSEAYDGATAVIGVDEDVVVVGTTDGDLADVGAGYGDYFLSRRDGDTGAELWSAQFGTDGFDAATDLALTSSGDLLVLGYSEGDLGGEVNRGLGDAFVSLHSAADGHVVWTRLFGTEAFDIGRSLTLDAAGSAYVSGETEGVLGAQNWGAADAFLMKLDASGDVAWTRQFGTETWDFALCVAGSDEVIAVAGDTYGELASGRVKGRDVFVAFYGAASGDLLGAQQFGTVAHDFSHDVAMTADGTTFLVGSLATGLTAGLGLGSFDAFATAISAPER